MRSDTRRHRGCRTGAWIVVLAMIAGPVLTRAQSDDSLDAAIAWPPRTQIQAALATHPRVETARAQQRGLRASGDVLRAGPNETVIRTTQARRRLDGPGGTQHEWQIGVERVLRSSDKRQADARLAQQHELLGEHLVEDARHETARELLRSWFSWLRAASESRLAGEQLALVSMLARSVERRVLAGDAARLEAGLANAELERSRAGALLARAREDVARLALRQRFPEILVESPDLPATNATADAAANAAGTAAGTAAGKPIDRPTPPAAGDHDRLRILYLERSHERELALGESRRAALVAERARAEQRTDPSLGAYTAFDRGGSEKILGLSLTIPLAGPAREATTRVALAEHQASVERVRDLERRLLAEFETSWSDATARADAARALVQAAKAQLAAARQVGRAYDLGEASLSEWLLARRGANDSQQQALAAQLDATEAQARLRLDLHELSGFDD